MKELKEAVPLTESQFNGLKLLLTVKRPYTGIKYWDEMTYVEYLERRKALAACDSKSNSAACCMGNPLHQVKTIWSGGDVSVTEDARTGEILEMDLSGDCDPFCADDDGDFVDFASNWEDYEREV